MSATVRIGTHGFDFFQFKGNDITGQSGTDSGKVLVFTNAF